MYYSKYLAPAQKQAKTFRAVTTFALLYMAHKLNSTVVHTQSCTALTSSQEKKN